MTNIPLRCFCGNAVLRPRMEHEANTTEVVTSLCSECDAGGFEETFYGHRSGRLMTWPEWMETQGLEA